MNLYFKKITRYRCNKYWEFIEYKSPRNIQFQNVVHLKNYFFMEIFVKAAAVAILIACKFINFLDQTRYTQKIHNQEK